MAFGSGSFMMDADSMVSEEELRLTNLVSATGADSYTSSCTLRRPGSPAAVSSPLVGTWSISEDCTAIGIREYRELTFTDAGELYLDGEVENYSITDSENFRRTSSDGATSSLYYYSVNGDSLSIANADPYGNPCVLTRV
jgi:hypothetical protein